MRQQINKICELAGWIGLFLIHGSTLPITLALIMGWSDEKPPIIMALMAVTGLGFFLLRSIATFDWLYLISNSIGFSLYCIMIYAAYIR